MSSEIVPASPARSSVVVEQCQVCGSSSLHQLLFLGYLPPVNQMPPVGERPREQPAFPAEWIVCTRCELVQLGLAVAPQILFPPEYPYRSGTTRILRDNFQELSEECRELFGLKAGQLVVDVGSNDGTLLTPFRDAGQRVYGIEPTLMSELANAKGIPTLMSFLSKDAVLKVRSEQGPAPVVTATNVFAHIEDVHAALEDIMFLLDSDGVFVSESHYLFSLLETLQFDTIYHEHLRYYSLRSLRYLLNMHGLEVVHARRIPTHGGSIRVYAARTGCRPARPSVAKMIDEEATGAALLDRLGTFREQVVRSKLRLNAVLSDIKDAGHRVYGVGAPSRASTLITYAGLDDGVLDCVVEVRGSHKLNKYMPGTMIPVVEEARLFGDQPEYALLLSWHIAEELMPKLTANGFRGAFIVPLPEPHIVRAG